MFPDYPLTVRQEISGTTAVPTANVTPVTSPRLPIRIVEKAPGIRLTSWARIAAKPPSRNNHVVDHSKGPQTRAESPQAGRTKYREESEEEQLRVVWITGCTKDTPLQFITEKIVEGPLLSVCFSEPDSAMCVIFQYAQSLTFFLENQSNLLQSTEKAAMGLTTSLLLVAHFR